MFVPVGGGGTASAAAYESKARVRFEGAPGQTLSGTSFQAASGADYNETGDCSFFGEVLVQPER